MKILKRVAIVILAYLAIVVVFESLIGYFQPVNPSTLVLTTSDGDGETRDRVLARLESGDQLYVAANHWPRAWYRRALENPTVVVDLGADGKRAHQAIPVVGAEHDRVDQDNSLGIGFRILTGFPPRYFLRLEPI
jgi:hypothetical protein